MQCEGCAAPGASEERKHGKPAEVQGCSDFIDLIDLDSPFPPPPSFLAHMLGVLLEPTQLLFALDFLRTVLLTIPGVKDGKKVSSHLRIVLLGYRKSARQELKNIRSCLPSSQEINPSWSDVATQWLATSSGIAKGVKGVYCPRYHALRGLLMDLQNALKVFAEPWK